MTRPDILPTQERQRAAWARCVNAAIGPSWRHGQSDFRGAGAISTKPTTNEMRWKDGGSVHPTLLTMTGCSGGLRSIKRNGLEIELFRLIKQF